MDDAHAGRWLVEWYDHGDRGAAEALIRWLQPQLHVPNSVTRVLGSGEDEALVQETLLKLLDPERRLLESADNLVAYARTVLANAARDALRKRRVRLGYSESTLREQAGASFASPGDWSIDTERALQAARELPLKQRLFVYLVSRPDLIDELDWAHIAAVHPVTAPPYAPPSA